jgi:hypothetical protein
VTAKARRVLRRVATRGPQVPARAVEADVCPPVLLDAYRETAGDLLETAELPGGHIVMWDAFTETAAAIERFLGEPAERIPPP